MLQPRRSLFCPSTRLSFVQLVCQYHVFPRPASTARQLRAVIAPTRCTQRAFTTTSQRTFRATPPRPFWQRTKQAVHILYREDPVASIIGFICVAAGAAGFIYALTYWTQVHAQIEHEYPEKVQRKLKRAIHFTIVEPDVGKAIKFYKQALELCEEIGMNPFSEQVIGIRLRLAAMLENAGQLDLCIKTLEMLKTDLMRWVEIVEMSGGSDAVEAQLNVQRAAARAQRIEEVEKEGSKQPVREITGPTIRQHRTRILKQAVGTGVKLGQLCADPKVGDEGAAGRHLEEALETALREHQRRVQEGATTVDDGVWMSKEEIGGTLEELAYHFDRTSQFNLSSLLFLRALTLDPPPCHAATVMNNLATSVAQSEPDEPETYTAKSALSPLNKDLLATSTAWAQKAVALAQSVRGDDRTAECDTACAAATLTLADLAALAGQAQRARELYAEGSRTSSDLGYAEGVERASLGLEKLDGKKKI